MSAIVSENRYMSVNLVVAMSLFIFVKDMTCINICTFCFSSRALCQNRCEVRRTLCNIIEQSRRSQIANGNDFHNGTLMYSCQSKALCRFMTEHSLPGFNHDYNENVYLAICSRTIDYRGAKSIMLCNKFYKHNLFATKFKHNFFYLENITTFCRCFRGTFCVCGIFDT